MATLRILSGGAAQAVVEQIAADFEHETGDHVNGEFSAVGAMAAKLRAGEPADIVILTDRLIDELIAEGKVTSGSRVDLGHVSTGVAVRAGTALPDVTSAQVLRANMLAATRLVCPDPAVATAGKVVMSMLEKLGIGEQLRSRMQFFPNGYAAMASLAAGKSALEIGITQMTEIRANKGVTLAGPLPPELQSRALYSAGLVEGALQRDGARDFMSRLAAPGSRQIRITAGFEIES
jgi:molybdate transport system substrate-binding protein